MKNYRFLDLTANPLSDHDSFLNTLIESRNFASSAYNIYEVSIFKTEILEKFRDLGFEPYFVAVFDWILPGVLHHRVIHADLRFNKENKSWDNVNFGVNWDIVGQGNFQWWNIPLEVDRIYPPKACNNIESSHPLNGMHYQSRGQKGISDNYTLIDEVSTARPMLIRTDIPHCVVNKMPRTCLSLRFKNLASIDYAEAYHRLDSISLE